MKLPSLTFTAAVVLVAGALPGSVSAVDCTDKQLDALTAANSTSIQKVCPSLFIEGKDAIDPTNMASLTTEALKNLAPCKESACVTELTKFVESAPDCLVVGLNIKATYRASLKLCQAFKDGTVTVAKATEIFGDVIKNASNAFESMFGDSSSDGSLTGKTTVAPPPSNSGEQTPSASKPGAAGSPAATTTAPAASKSAASLTTATGLAALVATTIAASLLI
jgi:hypothetical protein